MDIFSFFKKEKSITNITTIKYNEELKKVLTQARKEINPEDFKIDYNYTDICLNNKYNKLLTLTDKIDEAQKKLRIFYKENKYKLNFEETAEPKKFIKPNFYAFSVAYICDFNNCNSWKDITNEKNGLTIKDLDSGTKEEDKNNEPPLIVNMKISCCCSKNISIINFITSNQTGYSLITGEDCAWKHFIDNQKIKNELKIIKDKRKELKKEKKQEEIKKEKEMEKEERKKEKEKELLNKIEGLKKEGKHFCVECAEVLEEKWKTKCLYCYNKTKYKNNPELIMKICGKQKCNTPINQKYKYCYNCNLNK
jgi:hypothetical protein